MFTILRGAHGSRKYGSGTTGSGGNHRGLCARGGGGRFRQDPDADPALPVPREGDGHFAVEHPLRHVHQQGRERNEEAHPHGAGWRRQRLYFHVPRLLRAVPARRNPRAELPEGIHDSGRRRPEVPFAQGLRRFGLLAKGFENQQRYRLYRGPQGCRHQLRLAFCGTAFGGHGF